MFSGIVKGVGRVVALSEAGGEGKLTIGFEPGVLGALEIGSSIAVNGVCLTATALDAGAFTADVSRATLAVTTLGGLERGARVNLEPALRVGDALDGHWVTGHVDGVGRVVAVTPAGGSTVVTFELPAALARYVAPKGSIAVDGVSLTVNAAGGRELEVNLVPHTRSVTVAGDYAAGTAVNVEVDIIARYLERLLGERAAPALDLEMLKRHGFATEE